MVSEEASFKTLAFPGLRTKEVLASMKLRSRFLRTGCGLSVIVSFTLSACSGGGGGSMTPQAQSPAQTQSSSSANAQSSSRFLSSATQGAPDSSDIIYNANPPNRLAYAAGTKPASFPSPSQCVQDFGLACYTPAEIHAAYNIPNNLDGTGQTIVIVDAYGSPTVQSDLHTFDQAMGLPDPTLNIIYPGGKPAPLGPSKTHNTASWAAETSLDVQWAHAIAPSATIDLVIAANNGGNVLNNAVKYAVDNNLGSVISLSYGSPESAIRGNGNNTHLRQADAIFQEAQSKNITVFSGSGDSGASNGTSTVSANFPSSDPLVTAVGGTNLFFDVTTAGLPAAGYQGEDVWNDADACPFGCTSGIFGATGGAPSVVFAAPSYQSALSGNAARTTSDVAYNASVYTAVLVYLGYASPAGFYFFGGTSEGGPQWAGIIALANEKAGHSLGFINPALYAIGANSTKYANDFHDITMGDNKFDGPGFSAGKGYDIPTGLGTPNVTNLINDLTQ
jgi:subtilase family serine protease